MRTSSSCTDAFKALSERTRKVTQVSQRQDHQCTCSRASDLLPKITVSWLTRLQNASS